MLRTLRRCENAAPSDRVVLAGSQECSSLGIRATRVKCQSPGSESGKTGAVSVRRPSRSPELGAMAGHAGSRRPALAAGGLVAGEARCEHSMEVYGRYLEHHSHAGHPCLHSRAVDLPRLVAPHPRALITRCAGDLVAASHQIEEAVGVATEIEVLARELYDAAAQAANEQESVAFTRALARTRGALEERVRQEMSKGGRNVRGRIAQAIRGGLGLRGVELPGIDRFLDAAAWGSRGNVCRGDILGIAVLDPARPVTHNDQEALVDRVVAEARLRRHAPAPEFSPGPIDEEWLSPTVDAAFSLLAALNPGEPRFTRDRWEIRVYFGGYPWPFTPPSALHRELERSGVQGPSLSLAVALALLRALRPPGETSQTAHHLDHWVIATGSCQADRHIAYVTWIPQKARAAARTDCPLIYPDEGPKPQARLPKGSQRVATLDDAARLLGLAPAATLQGGIAESPSRTGNLPTPLTRFVRNERDLIQEVEKLVRSNGLVALWGPGGTGKSRLAIEVGWKVAESFEDGVWLVPLEDMAPGASVAAQLAAALRVPGEPTQLVAHLVAALRDKQALVILDNCESAVDSCARVATTLLSTSPKLRLICTTQVPLGVIGEQRFRVPTLALPDDPEGMSEDELRTSPAVALFIQHAEAIGARVAPADLPAIADICGRLGGLPLHIEWVAPWLSTMGAADIVQRLDDKSRRGTLLQRKHPQGPAWHLSADALVRHSLELLSPESRQVLSELGVFDSDFSLAAAESIVTESADVLTSRIHELVDRTLIQTHTDRTERRFRLPVEVRDLVRQEWSDATETELKLRHFRWVQSLTHTEIGEVPQQLERFYVERENLRAAFRFGLNALPEDVPQVLQALLVLWIVRGLLSDANETLADAPLSAKEPIRTRSAYHRAAGMVSWTRADYAGAASEYGSVLEACESDRTPHLLGWTEYWRGRALLSTGDRSGSILMRRSFRRNVAADEERCAEQSLFPFEPRGEQSLARRNYQAALNRWRERVERAREASDVVQLSRTLGKLAELYVAVEDFSSGLALYEEAVALSDSLGDLVLSGWLLHWLARCRIELGVTLDQAGAELERAEKLMTTLHNDFGLAVVLASRARWKQLLESKGAEDDAARAERLAWEDGNPRAISIAALSRSYLSDESSAAVEYARLATAQLLTVSGNSAEALLLLPQCMDQLEAALRRLGDEAEADFFAGAAHGLRVRIGSAAGNQEKRSLTAPTEWRLGQASRLPSIRRRCQRDTRPS